MHGQGFFTDSEVEQITLIAREEFEDIDDWIVSGVERRMGTRDVVDLHIQNELEHRRLVIPGNVNLIWPHRDHLIWPHPKAQVG